MTSIPPHLTALAGQRFFTYSQFKDVLTVLNDLYEDTSYAVKEIGLSVLKEPIFGLNLGTGSTKILMWSQMHGNESTTTRALLMFIDWFIKSDYNAHFKLYIIPVLNPDGLNRWTRENANGVDLNRDAQLLSQPESRILRTTFDDFKPDYCFNLHDQRTIYGVQNRTGASQCSFLAPAANEERSVTSCRVKAMKVINTMVSDLKMDVKGAIGRYDDSFNINCVGDTFQFMEVPTVLFEAGQSDTDYLRMHTRDIIYKSLISALKSIHFTDNWDAAKIIHDYQSIPTLKKNYTDILIKNVPSAGVLVTLSIMYREILENDVLFFEPYLSGVNDQTVDNAHKIIDFNDFNNESLDFEVSIEQRFTSNLLNINIFY